MRKQSNAQLLEGLIDKYEVRFDDLRLRCKTMQEDMDNLVQSDAVKEAVMILNTQVIIANDKQRLWLLEEFFSECQKLYLKPISSYHSARERIATYEVMKLAKANRKKTFIRRIFQYFWA